MTIEGAGLNVLKIDVAVCWEAMFYADGNDMVALAGQVTGSPGCALSLSLCFIHSRVAKLISIARAAFSISCNCLGA